MTRILEGTGVIEGTRVMPDPTAPATDTHLDDIEPHPASAPPMPRQSPGSTRDATLLGWNNPVHRPSRVTARLDFHHRKHAASRMHDHEIKFVVPDADIASQHTPTTTTQMPRRRPFPPTTDTRPIHFGGKRDAAMATVR